MFLYVNRGNLIKWFEIYLSGRSQHVKYEGIKSNVVFIKYGFPQESIFGPLLFIIYMNDIYNVFDIIYTILYADDTSALVIGKHIKNYNINEH